VRRRLALLLVAVAAAGPACHRADPVTRASGPPRCDVGLSVPEGFRVTGGMRDPHADHIGVRIDMRSDDGRELHYFAGVPGEFGEGLPERGEVGVRGGETGELLGAESTWVLEWGSGSPCTPVVVLATGMRRDQFTELLRAARALPAGSGG
jgi:hypothetical protein